jgi:hypothetical protein
MWYTSEVLQFGGSGRNECRLQHRCARNLWYEPDYTQWHFVSICFPPSTLREGKVLNVKIMRLSSLSAYCIKLQSQSTGHQQWNLLGRFLSTQKWTPSFLRQEGRKKRWIFFNWRQYSQQYISFDWHVKSIYHNLFVTGTFAKDPHEVFDFVVKLISQAKRRPPVQFPLEGL